MTPELQNSVHSPKLPIPTLSVTCSTSEPEFLLAIPIKYLQKGQCKGNMHAGLFWLIKIYIGLRKTQIIPIVKSKQSDTFSL